MSGSTARRTRPGNTHELTSPGTLNYGIIRSGSTQRWGTELLMKSSGNDLTRKMQRKNRNSPVRELPGSSDRGSGHRWGRCGAGFAGHQGAGYGTLLQVRVQHGLGAVLHVEVVAALAFAAAVPECVPLRV